MIERNPKWARDELILALDLYFTCPQALKNKAHPQVIELSRVLNALPIFSHRPDAKRFRNPNGVYMKLCNFLRLDPTYKGKGLTAGSRDEEVIWKDFANDRKRLHALAEAIRAHVSVQLPQTAEHDLLDDDEEGFEAPEGRVLLKMHRAKERNRTLVRKKKDQVLKKAGSLACEVCGFDFSARYGDLGQGFIEAHHGQPLATLRPGQMTKLSDLHLVCANCHRMLHRGGEGLTAAALRTRLTGFNER